MTIFSNKPVINIDLYVNLCKVWNHLIWKKKWNEVWVSVRGSDALAIIQQIKLFQITEVSSQYFLYQTLFHSVFLVFCCCCCACLPHYCCFDTDIEHLIRLPFAFISRKVIDTTNHLESDFPQSIEIRAELWVKLIQTILI